MKPVENLILQQVYYIGVDYMDNPNDPFAKAERLEEQGRFDLAEKEYHNAIQLGIGDQAIAHQGRCRSLARLGHLEEALSECEKALDLNPELHLAHGVLGYICSQQSQYEVAKKEFLKALDLQPGDIIALTNLVYVYFNLGEYRNANAVCKRAIQLHPEKIEMRIDLAHLYLSQTYFREAIEQLNEVRATRPGNSRVYASYAAVIVDMVSHYLIRLNPAVGAGLLIGLLLILPLGPRFLSLPIGILLSAFVLVSAFVYLWFSTYKYKEKGVLVMRVLAFYLFCCAIYWSIVFLLRPWLIG